MHLVSALIRSKEENLHWSGRATHTVAAERPGFGGRGDTIWCRNQRQQNIPVTSPSLHRPSPQLTFPRQQCRIVDCWATFLRWRFAWMSKWNISPRVDPLYLKGEPGTNSQQLRGLIRKWVSGCFWSKEAELDQSQNVCICWSWTCQTVRINSPILLAKSGPICGVVSTASSHHCSGWGSGGV